MYGTSIGDTLSDYASSISFFFLCLFHSCYSRFSFFLSFFLSFFFRIYLHIFFFFCFSSSYCSSRLHLQWGSSFTTRQKKSFFYPINKRGSYKHTHTTHKYIYITAVSKFSSKMKHFLFFFVLLYFTHLITSGLKRKSQGDCVVVIFKLIDVIQR